jgi:hypothetical protein
MTGGSNVGTIIVIFLLVIAFVIALIYFTYQGYYEDEILPRKEAGKPWAYKIFVFLGGTTFGLSMVWWFLIGDEAWKKLHFGVHLGPWVLFACAFLVFCLESLIVGQRQRTLVQAPTTPLEEAPAKKTKRRKPKTKTSSKRQSSSSST